MFFSKRDQVNSTNYFKKSINDYNIYVVSNDVDLENLKRINNMRQTDFIIDKDLIKLTAMNQVQLKDIDLIIYISNNDYNISIGERLRTLSKRISVLANKNITAAYIYKNKNKYVKLHFESNSYADSKIICLNNSNSLLNDLDLIALKHYEFDDNNKSKKYIK